MVAGRPVVVAVVDELRLDLRADVRGPRAAGVEAACLGRVRRARHVALEHDLLAGRVLARVRDRHRGEQRDGVRVDRVLVDLVRGPDLDDLAQVHHRDPVGDVADDAEVVGDEHVGEPELVLQVLEQVDDLRLDRDVEGRDGLVGDDHLRLQRERAGDADALALAARELVREALDVLGREPDAVEQLLDAAVELLARGDAVELQRVADDLADALARVQRRVGVLEDHLHLAPQRPQLALAQLGELGAAEAHRPRGRGEQLEHRARQGRLAATRLADEADRLALLDAERDAVDGAHRADLAVDEDPGLDREVLDEVGDLEQRLAVGRAGGAASRSRRRVLQPDVARLQYAQGLLLLTGEPAAVQVAGRAAALLELRLLVAAAERVRAARAEVTALGRRDQRRRLALDLGEAVGARPVEAHDRAEQAPGVGVLGVVEDLLEGSGLDHPAGVHHHHPVGDVGDDAEVVGDQDHREPALLVELLEQAEDLRLDRHVERRGRLVGDQHRRLEREAHGDHRALAHAARELVRVVVDPLLGAGNPDRLEQLDRALAGLGLGDVAVGADLLGDLVADLVDRVHRGHRVLEDHRQLLAADLAQHVVLGADEIGAIEHRGARDLRVRPAGQAHQRHRGDRLAAARLAHDGEHLAGLDVEGDPVDGGHRAVLGAERDLEVVDREQRFSRHRAS